MLHCPSCHTGNLLNDDKLFFNYVRGIVYEQFTCVECSSTFNLNPRAMDKTTQDAGMARILAHYNS